MEMIAILRAQKNEGGKRRIMTWRTEKSKKGEEIISFAGGSCDQYSSVAEQWLWDQQSGVLSFWFEENPPMPLSLHQEVLWDV